MNLAKQLAERFQSIQNKLDLIAPVKAHGRVLSATGTVIRASLTRTFIGELCKIVNPNNQELGVAEVIGIDREIAILTPHGELTNISTSTQIIPTGQNHCIKLGDFLLGSVVNGLGKLYEGKKISDSEVYENRSIISNAPDPLTRKIINKPITTGIKLIDGLITIGRGQRIGLFAAAGVGKSSLLGMLARHAQVDIIVIALIGERGREVKEFIEQTLNEESRKKTVVVVSTSDRPAMERLKSAYTATTIAEFFRDQGKNVLLLMDSVTRFARAQREIGLAAGEAPARRGFPPSVFAELPKLLERTGSSEKGYITAIYTVLVEGDDLDEPISDETRSILDGHIILSREIAANQQYPAIDPLNSLSRLMNVIVDEQHLKNAQRVRQLIAKYNEIELLVKVGEYQKGADLESDEALEKMNKIKTFFKQSIIDFVPLKDTLSELAKIAQPNS